MIVLSLVLFFYVGGDFRANCNRQYYVDSSLYSRKQNKKTPKWMMVFFSVFFFHFVLIEAEEMRLVCGFDVMKSSTCMIRFISLPYCVSVPYCTFNNVKHNNLFIINKNNRIWHDKRQTTTKCWWGNCWQRLRFWYRSDFLLFKCLEN